MDGSIFWFLFTHNINDLYLFNENLRNANVRNNTFARKTTTSRFMITSISLCWLLFGLVFFPFLSHPLSIFALSFFYLVFLIGSQCSLFIVHCSLFSLCKAFVSPIIPTSETHSFAKRKRVTVTIILFVL